jgi:hypothetical protein
MESSALRAYQRQTKQADSLIVLPAAFSSLARGIAISTRPIQPHPGWKPKVE